MTVRNRKNNPVASIIIPARNEGEHIEKCLRAVFRQKTGIAFEVLVIDSGSVDQTPLVVKAFESVKMISITPEEFGHGRTRNLGASRSSGRLLVFLNADAEPADENWLTPLVKTIEQDRNVAGVFSRHLPRPGCHLYMARDLQRSMPDRMMVKSGVSHLDTMLFSTVSAVVRRDIWNRYPFQDDIAIAEDQEWGKKVLKAGYKIVFQPASMVYHSHNYSNDELYRLKKSVGRSLRLFRSRRMNIVFGWFLALGGLVLKTTGDFFYIVGRPIPLKTRLKEMKISLGARVSGFRGRYSGWVQRDE